MRDEQDWKSLSHNNFIYKTNIPYKRTNPDFLYFLLDKIKMWEAITHTSYYSYRQQLKELAFENIKMIRDATIINSFNDIHCDKNYSICFIDDDDIFHPEIASQLPVGKLCYWNQLYYNGYFYQFKVSDKTAMIFKDDWQPIQTEVDYSFHSNNYAIGKKNLEDIEFSKHAIGHIWIDRFFRDNPVIELPSFLSLEMKTSASCSILVKSDWNTLKNLIISSTELDFDLPTDLFWCKKHITDVIELNKKVFKKCFMKN
jgi:hypothetical protein